MVTGTNLSRIYIYITVYFAQFDRTVGYFRTVTTTIARRQTTLHPHTQDFSPCNVAFLKRDAFLRMFRRSLRSNRFCRQTALRIGVGCTLTVLQPSVCCGHTTYRGLRRRGIAHSIGECGNVEGKVAESLEITSKVEVSLYSLLRPLGCVDV